MQPCSAALVGVVRPCVHVVGVVLHVPPHRVVPVVLFKWIIAAEEAACAAVCADILMNCMYPRSATSPINPNMGTSTNVNISSTWPLHLSSLRFWVSKAAPPARE